MQESIVVVTVPAGVSPGEEMVVCVDGVDMVVVVPPGAESGSLMDVMIPRKAEPATDGSEGGRRHSVDIELPCECRPGDELVFEETTIPEAAAELRKLRKRAVACAARVVDGADVDLAALARGPNQVGDVFEL